MEKKEFKTQSIVAKPSEFSEDAIQSLYAQIFLEYSLFLGDKQRLQKEIDLALDGREEEKFHELVDQYRYLLSQYEKGISLEEQGVQFHIHFGEFSDR
jgi:uncharacterized protein YpiB (UPF0302 family)